VVGQIKLVFGMKASFDQSYTVFLGNSGIHKSNGTSLWNFFLNSGISIVKHFSEFYSQDGSKDQLA